MREANTTPQPHEARRGCPTARQPTGRRSRVRSIAAEPPNKRMTCPICLHVWNDPTVLDNCPHIFCFECILEWTRLKPECPLCKRGLLSLRHRLLLSGGEMPSWKSKGQEESIIRLRSEYELDQILTRTSYPPDVEQHQVQLVVKHLLHEIGALRTISMRGALASQSIYREAICGVQRELDDYRMLLSKFENGATRAQLFKEHSFRRVVYLNNLTPRSICPSMFNVVFNAEYVSGNRIVWSQIVHFVIREVAALTKKVCVDIDVYMDALLDYFSRRSGILLGNDDDVLVLNNGDDVEVVGERRRRLARPNNVQDRQPGVLERLYSYFNHLAHDSQHQQHEQLQQFGSWRPPARVVYGAEATGSTVSYPPQLPHSSSRMGAHPPLSPPRALATSSTVTLDDDSDDAEDAVEFVQEIKRPKSLHNLEEGESEEDEQMDDDMNRATFLQRFVNNNPRNFERVRLQRKPSGWGFEKNNAQRNFIYRVDFCPTKNSTVASVVHYEDGTVIEASTREKTVQSQLYSQTDVSAAYNIGRLLAHRCKMAGIEHCVSSLTEEELEGSKRREAFLRALEESGLVLEEPEPIPHTHLNDPNQVWESFPLRHDRTDKLDELDLSMEPGKGVC
uniref:Large ribosomal subunit protein uL18m n=1 Tax=Globodera pallida TaxID=36090 RepID=A0A183CEG7_GLOPA